MRTIHLSNECTIPEVAQQINKVRTALQVQCNRDFSPIWGIWANLIVGNTQDPKAEVIHILDNSDQADALGYHERTPAETPVGYVFAKTTIDAGDQWSATLSHELLEQLVDPLVNMMVYGKCQGKDALYFYESCDAVENDEYAINGIQVSNFVTPAFFLGDDPAPPAGTKFDFLGKLSAPFTLDKGGYLSYALAINQWQQEFGMHLPAHQKGFDKFSRRGRRINKGKLQVK